MNPNNNKEKIYCWDCEDQEMTEVGATGREIYHDLSSEKEISMGVRGEMIYQCRVCKTIRII